VLELELAARGVEPRAAGDPRQCHVAAAGLQVDVAGDAVHAGVAAAVAQDQRVLLRHPDARADVHTAEQAREPALDVHLEAHVVAGALEREDHPLGVAAAGLGLDAHLVRLVDADVHAPARAAHEERPAGFDRHDLLHELGAFYGFDHSD
jgi:hypothetical protein